MTEEGWFGRCSLDPQNRNEGTEKRSDGTKNRNEGTKTERRTPKPEQGYKKTPKPPRVSKPPFHFLSILLERFRKTSVPSASLRPVSSGLSHECTKASEPQSLAKFESHAKSSKNKSTTLVGLETQTQNAAFFERKRPKRKPWHRGKSSNRKKRSQCVF